MRTRRALAGPIQCATRLRLPCLAVVFSTASVILGSIAARPAGAPPSGGALDGVRHRVIVSSDIGGSDPDDFQSMVHLLLYADVIDLEGLVSSPFGPGRREHILDVIVRYERDLATLRTHSDRYPTPDALRAMTKQGEIESNSTYRGWFAGGNQEGQWENRAFVEAHIAGHGALGEYFATHLQGVIKMGDSPTLAWLLRGNPGDPSQPGWGGRFVRAWDRPEASFDRVTTREDRVEQFGILELELPLGEGAPAAPQGRMLVENQALLGHPDGRGHLRFRFSPRDARVFSYQIRSDAPTLGGVTGEITAVAPLPSAALRPSKRFPNWWTDDPSPAMAEGIHQGARSVSQWREAFLGDFAARMDRCRRPAHPAHEPDNP